MDRVSSSSVRCRAMKKDGTQCRNATRSSMHLCNCHQSSTATGTGAYVSRRSPKPLKAYCKKYNDRESCPPKDCRWSERGVVKNKCVSRYGSKFSNWTENQ